MCEEEVDTPALILDLDAFEANLDHMAGLAATAGVKMRPHAKTHKSPVIAHLQLARGAVGQCTQKGAEAEILAWGGVRDILVSHEVMSPRKLARLAALTRIARSPRLVSLATSAPRQKPSPCAPERRIGPVLAAPAPGQAQRLARSSWADHP
jgi:D-serine deaminase-like pyridoxal phosphate-dependent protein